MSSASTASINCRTRSTFGQPDSRNRLSPPGLTQGTLLRKGDILGYVGSTGDASPNAPHLHFAVFQLGPDKKWWEGTAVDPLPLLKEK